MKDRVGQTWERVEGLEWGEGGPRLITHSEPTWTGGTHHRFVFLDSGETHEMWEHIEEEPFEWQPMWRRLA